ncbi:MULTISPECIES: hypothetical protein [Bacteria]|uniref:hypothetical protein n=1 Tax=Bacteria TaxID=2 RepID=UPI003C7C35BF
MKSRLAASLAISAAVIVGATGCSMISPQATTIQYSASDGVNVPGNGPVAVRNAFIVADEEGTGNLVAGLVNETGTSATLSVEVDGVAAQTVRVGAGKTVSLGGADAPLRIQGADLKPGATVGVYFQSGDDKGSLTQVPVLDGTLPYYADLVPSEKPTPEPTSTSGPALTSVPTPTSAPAS